MGKPELVRLRHTRPCAWTAHAADERSRELPGEASIAVLRVVVGEGFLPAEGRFFHTPEPVAVAGGRRPGWWFGKDQGDRRGALAPGAPLPARRHEDDGTPDGRAGPWTGACRLRDASSGSDAMEPRRIAEVGA